MSDLVLILWQPIFVVVGLAIWGAAAFWTYCLVLSLHDIWRNRTVRR